jgi:hypothetical protein
VGCRLLQEQAEEESNKQQVSMATVYRMMYLHQLSNEFTPVKYIDNSPYQIGPKQNTSN